MEMDGFVTLKKTKNFGVCGNKQNIKSIVLFLKKYFNWDYLESHNDSRSKRTFYFQTGAKGKLLDFINSYLALEDKCDLLKRKANIAKDIKNNIIYSSERKSKTKQKKFVLFVVKNFIFLIIPNRNIVVKNVLI